MRAQHEPLLKEIRETGSLTDEGWQKLDEAICRFTDDFLAGRGA